MAGMVKINLVSQTDHTLANELNKVIGQYNQLKEQSKKARQANKSAFSGMAGDLKSFALNFAAPAAAIYKLIGLIKQAREEHRALGREMQERNVSTAHARSAGIMNIGTFEGGGSAGVKAMDEIVRDVTRKIGGTMKDSYLDFSTIVSNREGQGRDVLQSAIEVAAWIRLLTGGVVSGKDVAGAAVALPEVTGSKNSKANSGRLLQLQSTIPTADPSALMNALPGIVALSRLGFTEKLSMQIFSSIANAFKDRDLTKSSNFSTSIVAAVKDKQIYPVSKVDPSTGQKKVAYDFVPGNNTMEKFHNFNKKFIESSREVQNKILESFSGRDASKSQFLRPFLQDGLNFKPFDDASKQIKEFNEKESAKYFNKIVTNSMSGPIGKALQSSIKGSALTDSEKAANPIAGYEEATRAKMKESFALREVPFFERHINTPTKLLINEAMGVSPTKYYLGIMQAVQSSLKGESIKPGQYANPAISGAYQDKPELLQQLIEYLQGNLKAIQAIEKKMGNITDSSSRTASNTSKTPTVNEQEER